MTKKINKAIMKRSRLAFLSNRQRCLKKCKKQRNVCANLLKRLKKRFVNPDVNSISDNKKFWQIVKPLFSNKVKVKTTIKLVENNQMIDDEIETAKLFNEYFVNIVKKSGLFKKEQSAVSTFLKNIYIYILVKFIKENIDIVSYFLYHNFNILLSCSTSPSGINTQT